MTLTRTIKITAIFRTALLFILILALSLPVPLISAQKESAAVQKDESVYAELAKAPKKAVARRNPMEHDPEAVAAGGKRFDLHCAECHGETAGGGCKAPSLRARGVQQATPGTIFWILTKGGVRRGLPGWSKRPEPQRWQIVAYLKSLGPAEKPSE